jgi:hypothetical protein
LGFIQKFNTYRGGNTRLLRNKEDIIGIYNSITDVPMIFDVNKNKSMSNTLAKLKKELKDEEYEKTNNNLYTKCCHTHLNYNYRSWSKYKKIKNSKEIEVFNLIEGTFDKDSNDFITTLCELLDKQLHILKIKNSKLQYFY